MASRDKEILEVFIGVKFDKKSPFPSSGFKETIKEIGYEITNKEEPITAEDDSGKKVVYSSEQSIINIREVSLENLLDSLEEVEDFIFSRLESNPSKLKGVEIGLKALVWRGESTEEVISQHYSPIDLGEKFEEEPKPYGLRFVSGSDFNRENSSLYDISIEPYVENDEYYYFEMNYRKPEFDPVKTLSEEIEKTIDDIISSVEKEVGEE